MKDVIEYLKHRSLICGIESKNELPIFSEINEPIDLYKKRMIEK